MRASDAGQLVYRATIEHMSWWNCDAFINDVRCIRGCVTFQGAPVRNAHLRVGGIDFRNEGSGFTNSDGCFAEDTRPGARLELTAEAIQGVSDPLVVRAGDQLMWAGQNPAARHDIGTIEIEPRDPASESCPTRPPIATTARSAAPPAPVLPSASSRRERLSRSIGPRSHVSLK